MKRSTGASPRSARPPQRTVRAPVYLAYEADTLEGLETFALEELAQRFGTRVTPPKIATEGRVPFTYSGTLNRLLECRSLLGVYRVLHFDVPRPKALLGHEHFTALLTAIRDAQNLHPPGAFRTLRLSAAGAESAVLQRLAAELERGTGLLASEQDDQDMLVRLRRDAARTGWEVLVSLSPRPLSSRIWRVCNLPGSMNATLAHAMVRDAYYISSSTKVDTVLNLCCGSGTLLIEWAALGPASALLGCDTSPAALDCARINVEAAGLSEKIQLHSWDATDLPLAEASVDVLLSDLPFGQRIGSHSENTVLYPRLLAEAARVARPGARMLLLTHEVRLLVDALNTQHALWSVESELRVRAGGMNPRVFRCVRTDAPYPFTPLVG